MIWKDAPRSAGEMTLNWNPFRVGICMIDKGVFLQPFLVVTHFPFDISLIQATSISPKPTLRCKHWGKASHAKNEDSHEVRVLRKSSTTFLKQGNLSKVNQDPGLLFILILNMCPNSFNHKDPSDFTASYLGAIAACTLPVTAFWVTDDEFKFLLFLWVANSLD